MLFGLLSLLLNQIFANSVVPIGTKIASPLIGPLPFVFFRFLISTVLLLLIYFLSKRKKLTIREYKSFAILGFLLMMTVTLFTFAIAHTTVIMSTLIFLLTPLLVGI